MDVQSLFTTYEIQLNVIRIGNSCEKKKIKRKQWEWRRCSDHEPKAALAKDAPLLNLFFGRAGSSYLSNSTLQHSKRRENGLWIWTAIVTSSVNSQNSWFSPPSCLAAVRCVCADLGQPEEWMLLRVGLSAWSAAPDLFMSVICSETLENPMKLCCWDTHRTGKGPEDKCGLAEP